VLCTLQYNTQSYMINFASVAILNFDIPLSKSTPAN